VIVATEGLRSRARRSDTRSLATGRAAGRIGLALTAVAIAIAGAWLVARDSDGEPVLVRGETRADVRGAFFEVAPPYFVAVYRGDASATAAGIDPVAEGDTDENGRFTLRADLSEDDTKGLYVYVTAYGYESACGYVELPPLRRGEEGWVDARTGGPLNVDLTLREPGRSGVGCD
jgi:hypothetical protein